MNDNASAIEYAQRVPSLTTGTGIGRQPPCLRGMSIPLKEPLCAGYALQRTVTPVEQRQPGVTNQLR